MTDYRKKEMLEMKELGKTNVAVGKHFSISGERVRQIIGSYRSTTRMKIIKECPTCKKPFKKYRSETKKYCCLECSCVPKRLKPDKPISKYTEDEKRVLNKKRNDSKKELRRVYYQKPEVKERTKKYRQTKKYKKYQREYYHKNKK